MIFLVFIAFAFLENFSQFLETIEFVFLIVLVHNGLGMLLGYGVGRIARLKEADARAISFETGIQNSGLALVIIFSYFQDLGGMAVLAGWWAIWDMISGMIMMLIWQKRKAV